MAKVRRIKEIKVEYVGPYSKELFLTTYVKSKDWSHVIYGEGYNQAGAAARALARFSGLEFGQKVREIEAAVQATNPSHFCEADEWSSIFCVISVDVER